MKMQPIKKEVEDHKKIKKLENSQIKRHIFSRFKIPVQIRSELN